MVRQRALLVTGLLASISSVSLVAQEPLALPPVKVKTLPVSAKGLVERADRAFVGVVKEVSLKGETLKDVSRPLAIVHVTFQLEQVLFDRTGTLQANQPYTVRLFAQGSRPVQAGERLLWYLAPASEDGLTQPVGIDSGHFRFTPDGRSVMNLKRNENLLEPRTISAQTEALVDEVPEARRAEFRASLQKWSQDVGAVGGKGKPVPLDLLIARTKQLVRGQ